MLKKIKYVDLVIALVSSIVLSFVIIQVIYNYNSIFDGVKKAMRVLNPFILSFVIAYFLNPIMMFFENKLKLKRYLSLMLTYSIIVILIFAIVQLLLPKLTSSIIQMFNDIPSYVDSIRKWVENVIKNNPQIIDITNMDFFKNNINPNKINEMLMTLLNSILSKTLSITSWLFNFILGLIISIYVLKDKEKFISVGKKSVYIIFRKEKGRIIINLIKNIDKMMSIYIGAKAVDSVIIAIISFVALVFLKSPYALLMTLIVGISNMIPYFGFIGIIPPIIINAFDSPIRATWVAIFLFAIQQFDALYLNPKLIGHKVGLNPFLIMVAIAIGGSLFGGVGMLLACPTMAVIKLYSVKIIKIYYEKIN